jgi:hypothetical protein
MEKDNLENLGVDTKCGSLVQDIYQWRIFVNMAMNIQVS